MRKSLLSKILLIIFFTEIIIGTKSFAASAGIHSTDKTVTSGTDSSVTVTVSSNAELGSYMVTVTDTGGLTLTGASGGVTSTDNKKVTSAAATGTTTLANFTFSVPNVSVQTKYVIKFSIDDMEDYNDPDSVSYDNTTNTATITVNPAVTTPPSSGGSTENEEQNKEPERTPEQTEEAKYPSETKPTETKNEEPKSSNNYLKNITAGTGKLSPEFYRETFEYTVEFDDTVNLYNLKEIEISATAEDERATIEGAGTIQLQEGENNITLTVKAENGSARTYTIKVVKPEAVEQSSLRLKTLVLNGINTNGEYQTINLDFDPETFEYNITVPNTITSISVNPTTENEDIIIESNGGENLNEGNNRIIIMLTSPSDDSMKTTYTINVERQAALITTEEHGLNNKQLGIIIIAGVVGIILLIVIITAIVKHRKKKKGFGFDDDEEDNEMHFINNEEGEDVKDYDEIESPYPEKIVTSGIKDDEEDKSVSNENKKDEEEKLNYNDAKENKNEDEDLKFKTTYEDVNIDSESNNHTKSKWDDFVDGYDDEEESKKTKKKNRGRRFL